MKTLQILSMITMLLVIYIVSIPSAIAHAINFTLVKEIDLTDLGIPGGLEVDVVGNELFVASAADEHYYRVDSSTNAVLGSFTTPYDINDHGSDFDSATGRLLHVFDDDDGFISPDSFVETDLTGAVVRGPFALHGVRIEDPGGLGVDPVSGRVWIATAQVQGGSRDVYEISRADGSIIRSLGASHNPYAVSYNPATGTLFYTNLYDQTLYEIGTDGSGERPIFTLPPSVQALVGISFTPTGDLVLLSQGLNTLFLYDSDNDLDTAFTTAVPNRPPVAMQMNLIIVGDEGSPITFDAGGSSDADGDPLQYRWDFNNDGTWDTGWSSSPTVFYTWSDDWTGAAKVEVSDGRLTDTDTASVTVNNVAPVVNAGSDATIDEGSAFSSSDSFTDPGADSWTATVDYGDGTGVQPLTLNPDKTFSFSHVYADNGVYTMTVTVIDDDGGVGSDIIQITVLNVPPTVDAGADQTITVGDFATFSGIFSDPGWLDTHTAAWDYGDETSGAGEVTEENEPPDATGTVTGGHSFFKAGEFTITLKVTDDDESEGSDTLKVTVKAIAATIDFDPDTLNKKSGNKLVTVYIELPEGFDVWQIDGSTVLLNGIVPAYLGKEGWAKAESNEENIMDHDGDGILERMVKFNGDAVKEILEVGDEVTVTVTGGVKEDNGHDTSLADFKGQDIIQVIEPGKAPKAAPAKVLGFAFAALSAYPQPCNPDTWIPYTLGKDVEVTITIYSNSGRVIRALQIGHQTAGAYISKNKAAYWDGRNDVGEKVSSGVYFYTIRAGDFTATRKLVVMR